MMFLPKMKPGDKRGFTLVEVVVVIAIFAVLSSITIFNYRDFDDSIKLQNQALGVALAIRNAQTYALSARESSGGSYQFSYPYGVYVDTGASYKNKATLFIDSNTTNRLFDVGEETATVKDLFTLENGYTVSAVCAITLATCDTFSSLSISYLRPNIDAKICADGVCPGTPYTEAHITVRSPKGTTKTVYVTQLGQIYVQ